MVLLWPADNFRVWDCVTQVTGMSKNNMHRPTRLKIEDVNPYLTCILCGGYFVDATTIIECLHSFCRTCIVKYLETSKFCPICDVQIHKTRPLHNIRDDKTLQNIVYKSVPGLFQNEMSRRREFYSSQPNGGKEARSSEDRGHIADDCPIFTPDEIISLSLEYVYGDTHDTTEEDTASPQDDTDPKRRFLQCPAAVTVSHLKKFVRLKYGIPNSYTVSIFHQNDYLLDEYSLMDIAYIYTWRRDCPIRLFYRILERPKKRLKISHSDSIVPVDNSEQLDSSVESAPKPEVAEQKSSKEDVKCEEMKCDEQVSKHEQIPVEINEDKEKTNRIADVKVPAKPPSSTTSNCEQTNSCASETDKSSKCAEPNKEPPEKATDRKDKSIISNGPKTLLEDIPDSGDESDHLVIETNDDDSPQENELKPTTESSPLSSEEPLTKDSKENAEDEAEATDDGEADSGRGSDISSRTGSRSVCDDDIGSPGSTEQTLEVEKPAPLPATSPKPATCPVNNEKITIKCKTPKEAEPTRDYIGALDLSTSHRKSGHERINNSKPRHVANPAVLDKHRVVPCLTVPKHPSFKLLPAASAFPPTPLPPPPPPPPPVNNNYKKPDYSRNFRCRGSLTVINPDPNSYRPKIVIKNLDPRPDHSRHHHHHHHHRM